MAAKAKKQTPRRGARRKTAIELRAVMYLFLLAVILLAALPSAIVLAVGIVPTIVALIVDLTPGRYLTRCVVGLNVAGVSPFIHSLWTKGNDISTAISIISDTFAWLVIYGASAIGWLLFLGLPGAVAVFQTLNSKRQVYLLQDRQKNLLEEWGDSIRSPAELARNAANASSANAAAPASSTAKA
jgi:hypothetical protein